MKHPYARAFAEMFGAPRPATATPAPAGSSVPVPVRRTTTRGWEETIRPVAKYLEAMMLLNRLPGQEGVDMIVLGDDRTKKLTRWAEMMEQKQGKPLNYVILPKDDFLYRQSVRDRFLMEILELEVLETYDPTGIFAKGKDVK